MVMESTKAILTFDDSFKEEILDVFGKSVDSDGFIVEQDNVTQRVRSEDGQEVNINEFGGIKKGSEVFIKKDLVSLMRLSKE
jgi:hypothetical protein